MVKQMRSDDLEFLIAQYADGTLDPEQRPEVEAILRRSESAQEMLESYRSLERLMSAQAAPDIRWDRLEDRISRQIATSSTASSASPEAAPFSEEVEEQISRLAEGNSSAAESRLIEARISADPQARLLLSEYASLERLFEAVRARPLPAVRWHRLNDHIAQTLGLREAEKPQRIATPRRIKANDREETGVLARIGNWFRTPQRLAMAACVLIAGAVGIRLMSTGSTAPNGGTAVIAPQPGPNNSVASTEHPTPKGPGILQVTGPSIGIAATPSNDQNTTANSVQVGPGRGVQLDPNALNNQSGEASANRGGSAIIAPDKAAGQDRDAKASREGWPFPR